MLRDVIIFVVWIARIVIAVRLLQLASRTTRNLYWLAGVFLVNAVYYISVIGPFSASEYVAHLSYTIGLTIAQLLVVSFIHTTFYQDRKSPFPIFLVVNLVVGVADTVLAVLSGPAVSLISVMVAINWGWHASIAHKAYKQIAGEKSVEDWIKTRYKLMIVYCVLLSLTGLILIGYLVPATMVAIQSLIGLFALVGVVLQFLVWVMPAGFRQFLNRNYQVPVQADQDITALSEEEIMRQLREKS